MDTLQLNRINELAREYLRLGIAKNTSDAVEKARFQLAFEKERAEPAESPYESLFNGTKRSERSETASSSEASASAGTGRREDLSPLDIKRDRYDEMVARLSELESSSERRERQQRGRIAELERALADQRGRMEPIERMIGQLRNEIEVLRQGAASARPEISPATAHGDHVSEPAAAGPVAAEGPISSTIEQTIKGRKISSADVAVDKIFYFGNR